MSNNRSLFYAMLRKQIFIHANAPNLRRDLNFA